MTVITLTLRIVAEAAAMAGPLFVWIYREAARPPRSEQRSRASEGVTRANRVPLIANALGIGLFFSCLWAPFALRFLPAWAQLALAASGLAVVIAALIFLLAARGALGASWSFAPKASQQTGLATSGPYGWVRHPIYFGMLVVFFGAAVAFANWLAMLLVVLLITPTLVWRAVVEERVLVQVFGDRYIAYRGHTKMIIPWIV